MYTWEDINKVDPVIAELIQKEFERQNSHIELIASENWTSPAVTSALGLDEPCCHISAWHVPYQ